MAGKAGIVDRIADSVQGLSRRQAAEAYEAVVQAVADELRAGNSAKVPGLGTFAVSERAARQGRNPATGEAIAIKASKSVRFKAGKDLKDAVNRRGGKKR
jgi:DNA-binding protein HU-beta